MERKKELVLDNCQIECVDNEPKTFELISEKGSSDHIYELVMSIPDEIRRQYNIRIATQGAGVKIYSSGEIEVTPPKGQLFMEPVDR